MDTIATVSATTRCPPSARTPTFSSLIDELSLNRRHWLVFTVCSLGFLLDSLDLQVLGLAAPTITREWGIDAKSMGFVFSATSTGMLCGSLILGVAADQIGRRIMLQATIALFSVFALLCAVSGDIVTLAALRFIVGFGIGGLIPINFSMMTEFMPAKQRGRMISLYCIFLPLGNFVAAGAAALILPHFGWQTLLVATALPGVVVFLVLLVIPESPRFLLRKGRRDAAKRALSWLSCGHVEASDIDCAADTHAQGRFSVLELFSPQYRTRTLLIWAVWFGSCVSYFGVVLFLPLIMLKKGTFPAQQVYYFIMAFAAAGIVGRLIASSVIDVFGRRPVLLVYGAGAAVAAWCLGAAQSPMAVIIAGMALGFFQDGEAGAMATWTPELYPTQARSTGIGFANGAGRVAAIVAPALIGVLIVNRLDLVFALFSGGFLVACVATLLLRVETKGLRLEVAAQG